MSRNTYAADFSASVIAGGGVDPGALATGMLLTIHVAPTVASTTPGSGLQVTARWNDGFGPLSDDTIISLDALTSGVFKQVPMWAGYNQDITLEATMFGASAGTEFAIDCDISLVIGQA